MNVLATRFTGGFANPNDAAACWLLAGLLVVLALRSAPDRVRSHRWAIGGVVLAATSLVVLLTESRGAFVALLGAGLAGAGVGIFRVRVDSASGFDRRWLGIAAAAAVALLAMTALSPMGDRLLAMAGGDDASAAGRWPLYASVPAMMAAAPGGWGTGHAARAWRHWYQPIGGVERYRHLLSSHATWLVEMSLPGRFAYLLGWSGLVVLAGSSAGDLAFAAAAWLLGCFNHVYAHPLVLAVLLAGVAGISLRAVRRIGSRRRLARRAAAASGLSLGLLLLVHGIGHAAPPRVPVEKRGSWVMLGPKDEAATIVPWIDERTVGRQFGHAAREAALGGRSLAVRVDGTASLGALSRRADSLLLLGTPPGSVAAACEPFPGAPATWINPPAASPDRALDLLRSLRPSDSSRPIRVAWGAWRRDASARPWRRACAALHPPARFERIEGATHYVADPFSLEDERNERPQPNR